MKRDEGKLVEPHEWHEHWSVASKVKLSLYSKKKSHWAGKEASRQMHDKAPARVLAAQPQQRPSPQYVR